ncbi:MAG: hypothetical protein Q4D77_02435 [Peptostreptococcaceae bacterium]|nr:hypothetical protein [Peptostreptococcaceae bacterium]
MTYPMDHFEDPSEKIADVQFLFTESQATDEQLLGNMIVYFVQENNGMRKQNLADSKCLTQSNNMIRIMIRKSSVKMCKGTLILK